MYRNLRVSRCIHMNISNARNSRLAAVVAAHDGAVNELMGRFALSLRERGKWVRGVMMTSQWRAPGLCVPALFDLDSGATYPLPATPARRREMPEVLAVMQRIVSEGADLVVLPRFSADEADGMGFAAEIFLLAAAGVPFLTTVAPVRTAAWQAFAGGGVLLPPSLSALVAWAERQWEGDGARAPGHQGCSVGATRATPH